MFRGISGWIVKTVCAVVLISSLTVYVAWNMMELYMGRLLTQIHPNIESEVELGQLLAQMAGLATKSNADAQQLSAIERITQGTQVELKERDQKQDQAARTNLDAVGSTDEEREEGLGESSSVISTDPPSGADEQSEQEVVHSDGLEDAAVPVFGQGQVYGQDQDASVQLDGDRFVMSADDFLLLQDRMTDEDKMAIFTIVMGNISQEDFQSLSLWLEDGLTAQEIASIYELLQENLTEREMTELASILKKYE